MFSTDDTIVAIATPPGRGAIGVVRLSGPAAQAIACQLLGRRVPLVPRRATLARVVASQPIESRRSEALGQDGDGLTRSRGVAQPSVAIALAATGAMAVDQVIATPFPGPASYTGEDVVEISAHGSPVLLGQIVSAAVDAGARLAEPGEFTLRAFLHGRMDLVQAEAVADLVAAVTPLEARAAFDQLEGTLTEAIGGIDRALFELIARLEASLDFPEEGYHFVEPGAAADGIEAVRARVQALLSDAGRGRLIREGVQIAILGKPNVGKSSLFNHLVGASRAIVTAVPGTTRDLITEIAEVEGIRASLIDTAGIRPAADAVEEEGVNRAKGALAVADLVVLVLDASRRLEDADRELIDATARAPRLIVVNKIDLARAWIETELPVSTSPIAEVSLRTGEGTEGLRPMIARALGVGERTRDTAAVTNIRHVKLLERAERALSRASEAITLASGALPEEFILADLEDARLALEEITGKRTSEDLLRHIFERFCIGK